MKRIIAPAVLLGTLLLTGCSGLVESGSEVNSKVPEKLGDYKLITAEMGSQTGFCDGPTAVERINEPAYSGEFLYVRDGYKLPESPGGCIGGYGLAKTDGVLVVRVTNYVATGSVDGCEIQDFSNNLGITVCKGSQENVAIELQSMQIGPEAEFRSELAELGETFLKKAELKIPERS